MKFQLDLPDFTATCLFTHFTTSLQKRSRFHKNIVQYHSIWRKFEGISCSEHLPLLKRVFEAQTVQNVQHSREEEALHVVRQKQHRSRSKSDKGRRMDILPDKLGCEEGKTQQPYLLGGIQKVCHSLRERGVKI